MPFNIEFTKALVLTGLLVLVALFTFNKIIQQNRLEIFRKYSDLQLPPDYEIKLNTAGTGNYRTIVLLVFEFDKTNYKLFVRRNKIGIKANSQQNQWQNSGAGLRRKRKIDSKTTILEIVYPAPQRLEFRYTQQ